MLGNYQQGEPRLVVMMDYTSMYTSDAIDDPIEVTGVVMIYCAPLSPHLNPIEPYSGIYKSYLKQNRFRMGVDWYTVHKEALNKVDYEMGLSYFQKCGISGSSL